MTASIADKEDIMNAVRDTAARVHAARLECIAPGTAAQYEKLCLARAAFDNACTALINRLTIGLDLSTVPTGNIVESLRRVSNEIAALSWIDRAPTALEVDLAAAEAEFQKLGAPLPDDEDGGGAPDLRAALSALDPNNDMAMPSFDVDDTAGTQLAARPGDPTISEAGE